MKIPDTSILAPVSQMIFIYIIISIKYASGADLTFKFVRDITYVDDTPLEPESDHGYHFSMDDDLYDEIAEEVKEKFDISAHNPEDSDEEVSLNKELGTELRLYEVEYMTPTVDEYLPPGPNGELHAVGG